MLLHKSLNVNNVWKGTRCYINIFGSILQKKMGGLQIGALARWCVGALVQWLLSGGEENGRGRGRNKRQVVTNRTVPSTSKEEK